MHHFKWDLINNIDHMRISGIEPSSVVLGQEGSVKMFVIFEDPPFSILLLKGYIDLEIRSSKISVLVLTSENATRLYSSIHCI